MFQRCLSLRFGSRLYTNIFRFQEDITLTKCITFKNFTCSSYLLTEGLNQEKLTVPAVTTDAVSNVRPPLPIWTGRQLSFPPKHSEFLHAWVENLDTLDEEKLGLIDLHPDIYGAAPRIDILHQNVRWQLMYRKIDFRRVKTRAECRGGGRKPWPQKGLGRARHGSIRSPIFLRGGKAHGPRGPKSYFYMLPIHLRLAGLVTALSCKMAQDDLHIVESLEIPTDDPKFLQNLAEKRNWGASVLFVEDTDFMPRNITLATETIPHYNLMPVYGLNVYSMLKHETLVLTVAAVERIEERILFHLNKNDVKPKKFISVQNKPKSYEQIIKHVMKPM